MNQSPILKALSILRAHKVKFLLMGGQACIIYGAAEFSRDIDLAIMVSNCNIEALQAALSEFRAVPRYVPALSASVLRRGHACHFGCRAPGVEGLRIDVMGKMRGVRSFSRLWLRREEFNLGGAGRIPVMSLQDLVAAKKTQRDKDWPMIRRLVEADIHRARTRVPGSRVLFWLAECRTPELLVALAGRYSRLARRQAKQRPLLKVAVREDTPAVVRLLAAEQRQIQTIDKKYWTPLRKELERWRHA